MKKQLALVLLPFVATVCLTACSSNSYSTSQTDVQVTTTVDGETTEHTYSSETTTGTPEADTTETQAPADDSKYDSSTYDLKYMINDDGNLVFYVEETDKDYWRQLDLQGYDDQLKFVADEIDENNVYYAELESTVEDGDAFAVIGHFTTGNEEEAVDFAIINVTVEGGKITDVTNSGFTDDLQAALN